jgi:hypothetical protein
MSLFFSSSQNFLGLLAGSILTLPVEEGLRTMPLPGTLDSPLAGTMGKLFTEVLLTGVFDKALTGVFDGPPTEGLGSPFTADTFGKPLAGRLGLLAELMVVFADVEVSGLVVTGGRDLGAEDGGADGFDIDALTAGDLGRWFTEGSGFPPTTGFDAVDTTDFLTAPA